MKVERLLLKTTRAFMKKKRSKVFLIEQYYNLLGNRLFWNEQKALDLCRATRMEPEELAALLRMRYSTLKNQFKRGKFNPQLSLLMYQIAVNKGYYAPHPITKRK